MRIYIPRTVISSAWLVWYVVAVDNVSILEASLWVKLPFIIVVYYSCWLVIKGIDDDTSKVTGVKYFDKGRKK